MNQREGCRCWMNTDDPTPPAITGRTHANWKHTRALWNTARTHGVLVLLMRNVFFYSIDHNIYMHK